MTKLAEGTVHKLPNDLKQALQSDPKALSAWQEKITPIARNEWICWTVTVKQQKTRDEHVKRTVKELAEGKRRPCCWIGCIHRTDKAISPSVQGILSKRTKSK
ncbi:YdeI/OmpD-associated family protein [Candidatus Saccharibacteria bacterium]|nr:YdeI/OmpD-associated family protein [Candidatus Saccharibacteria bacterium]